MAQSNVSQVPFELSGLPTTTNARVSQVPFELTGNPTTTRVQVSQIVFEISAPLSQTLTQTATFTNTNSFPAGGYISQYDTLVQTDTYVNPNSFPAGGGVLNMIAGQAIVPSTAQVFSGGSLSLVPPPPSGLYNPIWAGYGQQSMVVRRANEFDLELAADKLMMEMLMRSVEQDRLAAQRASRGGLGSLGADRADSNPSKVSCHKVNLRKNLFERGKLLTPADGGAADHTVLEFWVPTGYSCSLLAYYTIYTGTGFVQGSGDIVWRLKIGNAWARNMGSLPYAMGSSSGTVTLGTAIELESDDRVQFVVNVPNLSGLIQVGASYILCGVQGWLYPDGSWEQRSRR